MDQHATDENLHWRRIGSPLGDLLAGADRAGVRVLAFADAQPTPPVRQARERVVDALLDRLARELDAYFAGSLRRFTIPFAPRGTPFRQRVWQALCTIGWGRTCSYAELAAMAGSPKAVRAAGQANAANPIAILIPCHRVIRSDGQIGGYAGGIARKRALLALEGWRAADRGP